MSKKLETIQAGIVSLILLVLLTLSIQSRANELPGDDLIDYAQRVLTDQKTDQVLDLETSVELGKYKYSELFMVSLMLLEEELLHDNHNTEIVTQLGKNLITIGSTNMEYIGDTAGGKKTISAVQLISDTLNSLKVESEPSKILEKMLKDISTMVAENNETVPSLTTAITENKMLEHFEKRSDKEVFFTALHEAGHSMVLEILFGSKMEQDLLSVIPGKLEQQGQELFYNGVTSFDTIESLSYTRQAVINFIAFMHAGYMAQELTSRGGVHDEGKGNDIKRATDLARIAILKWGLLSAKGQKAGMVMREYSSEEYTSLPEERRENLEKEIDILIKEGNSLARKTLLYNFDHLVELGSTLATQGEMNKEEILEFYSEREKLFINPNDVGVFRRIQKIVTNPKAIVARVSPWWFSKHAKKNNDGDLLPTIEKPKVISLDGVIELKKQKKLAQQNIEIGSESSEKIAKSCMAIF